LPLSYAPGLSVTMSPGADEDEPRMQAQELFDLPPSLARFAAFFRPDLPAWDWIKAIGPALADVDPAEGRRDFPAGIDVQGRVIVHPSVRLPAYATLQGPCWIGPGTEIRPGAFVRGNVIAGEGCVLGNASEFKNCLLLDGVQAPHFNYVGDSVLGNRAHLGAGVICSNLRLDQKPVVVRIDGVAFDTGLRKFGALLGDGAEAGCNAVLNPGAILGRRALVMPTVAFAGVLPASTIARVRQTITVIPRRD
jgi:UDP-N-acetylglucosamine diphosphorylase / glucose-1-phosphate thymidylyltransferase / UDP-N-acetylgalactosamine diphosphorylase / glucosamine-1-phosphate N-acetyltransferase / galactosamine-1-phosphate N-acetyltransferase